MNSRVYILTYTTGDPEDSPRIDIFRLRHSAIEKIFQEIEEEYDDESLEKEITDWCIARKFNGKITLEEVKSIVESHLLATGRVEDFYGGSYLLESHRLQ